METKSTIASSRSASYLLPLLTLLLLASCTQCAATTTTCYSTKNCDSRYVVAKCQVTSGQCCSFFKRCASIGFSGGSFSYTQVFVGKALCPAESLAGGQDKVACWNLSLSNNPPTGGIWYT